MAIEQTRRRREAVATVHDIVSAMRAIAAGRIQAAQRALDGARRYHAIVMRGLATLLAGAEPSRFAATDRRPTTLLVMTSEQPFCGSFNENLITRAERLWREWPPGDRGQLLVVGQRGIRQLLARGIKLDGGESAATSLDGLQDLVKRLAMLLGRRYASGELRALRVLYNRYQSISEQIPTEVTILPTDLSQLPAAPSAGATFAKYLSSEELLTGLVYEYAFISLYLIAVESFTSEQASRLVAMDASTRNTERIQQALLDLERRERQDQITGEVLELISARFAAE